MTDHLDTYLEWQSRAAAVPPPVDEASPFAGAGDAVHAGIAQAVEALRPELERLARELHEDPEIGFEEHRSARRVADLLAHHGYDAQVGAFGLDTAVRATAGTGDGPHFALLAEYDALPGIGQACGHNIIAGMAVGAFLATAPLIARLGGRLSLIGTPAEENGGGKELIIRAGGFDDVDAAGMAHPGAGSGVTSIAGTRMSGVRRVAATFRGRAAHAAGSPWLGRNALDGVVTAYQSIAQLRQHILPIDRVHAIITDGGAAPNIVPETAALLAYVRSGEVGTLRALTDRVVAALEGAALATGTVAEIEVDPVPPYLPLEANVELTKRWARTLTARGRVVPPPPAVPEQGGASTDMGNVTRFIPAIHPSIGLGGPEDVFPHNAAFAGLTVQPPAFDALADGAAALASTAADYLADAALREAVQVEFEAHGGRRRWEG